MRDGTNIAPTPPLSKPHDPTCRAKQHCITRYWAISCCVYITTTQRMTCEDQYRPQARKGRKSYYKNVHNCYSARHFPPNTSSSSSKMRYTALFLIASPLLARAYQVVISNDDGWAEQNVRTFYNTLTSAGFSAILSSPAENQSGTGSSDSEATQVGSGGCQFGSCSAGSPATGFNASNTRLNV